MNINIALLPYSRIHIPMKTTIDLPEDLFERTKIAAAKQRTTLKNLVIRGLETVLKEEAPASVPIAALARLRGGYHLGGQPLTHDQVHGR